ncbi:hypothetical protein C8R45DRAFT_948041 [Mycena sanguinolenta]|nr:hypothetical protein C8R45DRAFT_948041 [Mycena sanguinolenta]
MSQMLTVTHVQHWARSSSTKVQLRSNKKTTVLNCGSTTGGTYVSSIVGMFSQDGGSMIAWDVLSDNNYLDVYLHCWEFISGLGTLEREENNEKISRLTKTEKFFIFAAVGTQKCHLVQIHRSTPFHLILNALYDIPGNDPVHVHEHAALQLPMRFSTSATVTRSNYRFRRWQRGGDEERLEDRGHAARFFPVLGTKMNLKERKMKYKTDRQIRAHALRVDGENAYISANSGLPCRQTSRNAHAQPQWWISWDHLQDSLEELRATEPHDPAENERGGTRRERCSRGIWDDLGAVTDLR